VAIVVACRCGQAFEADGWLAGKVVQCPACRSPIAVPSPVAEMTPTYVPRPPPAVSRESREAAQSIVTFLAAGVVIFMVVVVLSVGVVCFLQGKNPIAMLAALREQGKREREARWAARLGQQGTRPAEAGLLPSTNPPASVPIAPLPAKTLPAATAPTGKLPTSSGIPSGWNFYEHATGRFSAAFPDLPSTLERKIEATSGDSTIYLLTLTHGSHVYEASREFRSYAIPSGGEAATYGSLLSALTREMENGKVEVSNNATVDGRSVCDAILRGKVEGKEVRKYLRLIVSGDSVFQLSCTVPPGSELPADIKVFLGNYQLQ
jgi:hypothetical protein